MPLEGMARAASVLVEACLGGSLVCLTASKDRSKAWQTVAFAVAALSLLPGCVGVFAASGGVSLSWGTHSHGVLLGAVALPVEGDGDLFFFR